MRFRHGTKALLAFTAIVALAIAFLLPSIKASAFVDSFSMQSENRFLRWLDLLLRDRIHEQTKANGLTTIGCGSYHPVLEPITFADMVWCKRRIRLQHLGAWDPIDRELAQLQFLKSIEDDFGTQPKQNSDIMISMTLGGASVIGD